MAAPARGVTESAGPLRVVVTGTECTGKTTLARELARHYGVPHSEEFARRWAEERNRALGPGDLDPIARGQIAAEDEAVARARRERAAFVVHDTDLVSTAIWARVYPYYRGGPDWIPAAASERRADLYLLAAPDVPWIADGVRDRPADRDRLHELFARALDALAPAVVLLTGGWAARAARAHGAIRALGLFGKAAASGRIGTTRPARRRSR